MTFVTLASLLGFVLWQTPVLAQSVWLACQSAAATLGSLALALGLLLPLLLLIAGLANLSLSALVQMHYTRRLVTEMRARRLGSAPVERLLSELGLAGRVVVVADDAAYTFTQGLWTPRIWISTGMIAMLDEVELRAVLRHERYHLQQRDPLRVFLSRCLARALFFVPVAANLRDDYLVAKEVEADVASEADEALAAALFKLLRSGARLPQAAAMAAIGPVDATSARIERLLTGQRSVQRQRLAPLLASLIVALALATVGYLSTARAATPLAGGECGYSAPLQHPADNIWLTPVDSEPASYVQP